MGAESIKLDKKDRLILFELQKDCRRSLNEIAKEVKVSPQALHYRIERLVKSGAISNFITLIDFAKLGFVSHEVWLQLSSERKEERAAFVEELISNKNIWIVAECSGKYDLLVGIPAKNIVQFYSILNQMNRKHPGLVKVCHVSIPSHSISYQKAYLGGKEAKRGQFLISGEPQQAQMDAIELKLLSLLSTNARMPIIELAKKADTTPATVRVKMKRLEKEGIIAGYSAFISHQHIGYDNFEILASLRGMDEKKEKELEQYCFSNPYSTFLIKCIGKWDIDVGFDATDSQHAQKLLADFRDRFGDMIDEYDVVPIASWRKFTYYPF